MTASRPAGAVRSPLAELGTGAAWLVGLSAVAQMIALLFQSNPLAIVVLQAVVIDLALGRAGVRWDPEADASEMERQKAAKRADGASSPASKTDTARAVRGVAIGMGAAAGVIAAVMLASTAFGWARVSVHIPGTSLAIGLLRAIAVAVRDGLLYAGLPITFVARAKGTPAAVAVVFGAAAAGSVLVLEPAASPANVTLTAAVIAAAAALWHRERNGWMSAGLLFGWSFFAGTVMRGALMDVDWKSGSLTPGVTGAGAPAWIATVAFIGLAVWAFRGAGKPTQ
ncbi:MAG: hypothetical protein IPK82_11330 [Polyangiaceae bacterium]|nr:hypothetical protein [Polyangiaceae bacterium]